MSPIVSRAAPGKRANLTAGWWCCWGRGRGRGRGTLPWHVRNRVRRGRKGKKEKSSFQPSINAQPPVSKSLLMYRRRQGSSKITAHFLFFFSLPPLHLATYINPFPFNLVHCQPSLGYICVPLYLLMRSSEPGAWRWEGSGRSVR